MNRLLTGTLLAIITITGPGGCTSTGRTMLEEAQTRETTLSESYTVSADDRFFTATVRGSDAPTVTAHEEFYQLSIPIGTRAQVECLLYTSALDSASALDGLLNELLADFPQTAIQQIDAGTFGPLPYLYQESLYVTDQRAIGVLKGIVVPAGSSTLACLHDEPGYRDTFRQVVGSLADSLHIENSGPEDWEFQEILVWRVQDLNVGFTVNSIGRTGDGQIRTVLETAAIIPRTATQTMTHDGYDIIVENDSGELVAGNYAEAEGGELTLSIDLEQVPDGGYRVSGQFQGKEIDSRLDTETTPVGPYRQLVDLVRAANSGDGKPRTISTQAYVPSANPLQLLTVEAKPTGQRISGLPEYALLFAGMEAKSVIDDMGQRTITLHMGPTEMQLTRVYVNGRI